MSNEQARNFILSGTGPKKAFAGCGSRPMKELKTIAMRL
jgi:hypothetical protein